jgi:hypothetical protein
MKCPPRYTNRPERNIEILEKLKLKIQKKKGVYNPLLPFGDVNSAIGTIARMPLYGKVGCVPNVAASHANGPASACENSLFVAVVVLLVNPS